MSKIIHFYFTHRSIDLQKMIVIQTNRIFVVPEVTPVKNIPIQAEIKLKKEQPEYTKKSVKYFIPEFYI